MLRRSTAGLIAAALTLVACGGGGRPSVSAGPRSVTLITHDSFDVSKELLASFERRSGITVKVLRTGDAGQLVNRAILTAGNPEGDVLFGVDESLLGPALDANLFVPYASPRLGAVDDRFEVDPQHRVTPIDHGDVCVNVDLAYFREHGIPVPSTLDDLARPVYRGLLVVENPATSSPGLAFLLASIARFGESGWRSYWEGLRANDVLVVNGWERAYYGEFSGAGGGSGTRPLVVSYASSPPAEVVFGDPTVTEAPTGVIEDTCYRQIEFAGILAGTTHETEARALIDFLLSRPFQEDVPLRMFVFPVTGDARLPEVFERFAVVPASALTIPVDRVAQERAGWVDAWTDVVLR